MRQRRLPFIRLASGLVRFLKADADAFLIQNLLVGAPGHDTGNEISMAMG